VTYREIAPLLELNPTTNIPDFGYIDNNFVCGNCDEQRSVQGHEPSKFRYHCVPRLRCIPEEGRDLLGTPEFCITGKDYQQFMVIIEKMRSIVN